jgi:hypothetical protein
MFLLLMVPVNAGAATRDETAMQVTAASAFAERPAQPDQQHLPFTGSDARAVAMLGAALVMIGGTLTMRGARRGQPSAPSGTSWPTSS